MARRWDGWVWKIQLAIFVFVALSSGRRLVAGIDSLATLGGAGDVVLFVLAAAGGLYVGATQQPVSALFGPDRASGES